MEASDLYSNHSDDPSDYGSSVSEYRPNGEENTSDDDSDSEASMLTDEVSDLLASTSCAAKTFCPLQEDVEVSSDFSNFQPDKGSSVVSDNCSLDKDDEGTGQSSDVQLAYSSHGTSCIEVAQTANRDGRKWNKKDNCYFCDKLVSKLMEHFETMHKNETEVAKIMALPLRSKQRSEAIQRIRNKGNFNHNMRVIRSGKGTLLVKKRPSDKQNVNKYLPCEFCKMFMSSQQLALHVKKCPEKGQNLLNPRQARARAYLILPSNVSVDKSFEESVLRLMKQDDVFRVIRNDPLILSYGNQIFRRHGTQKHLKTYVSTKMREIGRLLIAARSLDQSIHSMEHLLQPQKFETVAKAAKMAARFDDCSNEYQCPSLALKIGYSVKNIASILRGQLLCGENEAKAQRVANFLELMDIQWANAISSTALENIAQRKFNKPAKIPLAEDLKKLTAALKKTEAEIKSALSENKELPCYVDLARTTLTQVVLFNRRRVGEVERLTISVYRSRQTGPMQEEVNECLTTCERTIAASLERIETRGKRGRKVPILLTQNLKESVELLLSLRSSAGIPNDNDYVFARPGDSQSYYRGADVLRVIVRNLDLKHPEYITSTKLRKHIATMTQLLSMGESELKLLADFMGHNLKVHDEFYRLPEATIQLAKVSKLLIALDKGVVSRFKNQNIFEAEVNLDDTDDSEVESEEEAENTEANSESEMYNPGINDARDNADRTHNTTEHSHGHEESISVYKKPLQKLKRKMNVIRKPWSNMEKNCVLNFFRACIDTQSIPGKKECLKCIEINPILQSRTWVHIKSFVHNEIQKQKKKKAN